MTDKMADKPLLTARDVELLTFALQCLKDPSGLQVDYKKYMELANLKSTSSASASWLTVKKKLVGNTAPAEASSSNANDATPTKAAKATPKKRGPKIKTEATDGDGEANADDEKTPATKPTAKKRAAKAKTPGTEGDGEANADDEGTPSNSPKKKGGAKRKAAVLEPASPSNDCDAATEDATLNGADATTDGTPAKQKRKYTRKPKDPNAPPAKRAKKGTNARSAANVAPASDNAEGTDDDAANAQLLDEFEGQAGTLFGDGNIKTEGKDDGEEGGLNEEEQYETEKVADETLFGTYTNGEQAV